MWNALHLFCSAEGNECIKANALSCGECIQVGAKCGWCTDPVSSVQMPGSFCSLTLQTQIYAESHSHSCWLIRAVLIDQEHDYNSDMLLYNSSINKWLISSNLMDQADIMPKKMTQRDQVLLGTADFPGTVMTDERCHSIHARKFHSNCFCMEIFSWCFTDAWDSF